MEHVRIHVKLAMELILLVLPAIAVEVIVRAIIAGATRIFVRQDVVAAGVSGTYAFSKLKENRLSRN